MKSIRFLRTRNIEVRIVPDPTTSTAARQCIEPAARFRQEKPDLWQEDWGG